MITRIFVAVLCLAASATASADFVGIYAGAGYWNQDFSGNAIDKVDVKNELGLDTASGNTFYVAIEHPVPVLPNVRVERTSISDSGSGTVHGTFTYEGQVYTANQQVNSEIDLSHTDLTLYYEIIDTGMDFDLGLTGRFVKGNVRVDTANQDVDVVLPMLYGHVKVGLPFTGTYFNGNANLVSYKGNSVTDFSLGVGWETDSFIFPEFGVEGGYRRYAIDVSQNDANVQVDAAVKGVYLNLTAHF